MQSQFIMKIYLHALYIIAVNAGDDDAIQTTWLWGEMEDFIKLSDKLNILDYPDLSFIRLEKFEKSIQIELVHRGENWPTSEPFCKTMVPAVFADFLRMHSIDLERDVRTIEAYNAARPRIAGCRCYVRFMVSIGFTNINSRLIRNEDDLTKFCEKMPNHSNNMLTAHKSPLQVKGYNLPQISQETERKLSKAQKLTKYINYWD